MPQEIVPTPEFPSKIDSSMLTCFDSCRHKFFREYILGLAPYAISPDLHAGGAMAHGFELARKAYYKEGKSAEESIFIGAVGISDFWGDYNPTPMKGDKEHIKSLVNT